jgi:hypothetical protein
MRTRIVVASIALLAVSMAGCRSEPDNPVGAQSGSGLDSPSAETQSVEVAWQPPTANSDGTPLSDLAGYNLYFGSSSHHYTHSIPIPNAGITTYLVQDLPSGTYYFSIAAYNTSGVESSPSPEVTSVLE